MNKSFLNVFKEFLSYLKTSVSSKSSDSSKPAKNLGPYQWLLNEISIDRSTRVQKLTATNMEPGKIYIYTYDAKTKSKLDYWDRTPIMLYFGKRKSANGSILYVGINISWYPPKYRKRIIKRLKSFYKTAYSDAIKKFPHKAKEQAPVVLDLYSLKLAMDSWGFSFALRTYLPNHIKSPLLCVCYDDWDKIVEIDQPNQYPSVSGKVKLNSIYKMYEKYVIEYNKNLNRNKKRIQEAKKQGSYNFIK